MRSSYWFFKSPRQVRRHVPIIRLTLGVPYFTFDDSGLFTDKIADLLEEYARAIRVQVRTRCEIPQNCTQVMPSGFVSWSRDKEVAA